MTISHLFVCLPSYELTTLEQQVCSTTIGYANALSFATNKWKGDVATLNSAHQAKIQCDLDKNNNRAVYMAPSESCELKRFVQCCNKVQRKYIQEQQPNQFHCYNQNMDFANRMDQKVAKCMIGILMKKWWWSPFVWMVNVVLHGVRVLHRINKDKDDESLPLLSFQKDVVCVILWKIHRKADYPRAIQEFKISLQMFVIMTQSITRSDLDTYVFRTPSNI